MIYKPSGFSSCPRGLALGLAFSASVVLTNAQTITQTFNLQPGWNSIFLEVTPANPSIAAIFSNPAIAAVAEPKPRLSTAAFVQSPNTPPINTGGWLIFIPTNKVESVNNNLFNVQVNHAYLVEVTGAQSVTVNVMGPPSLRALPFQADGYTLRGFPVDPAAPPSFQSFFAASTGQTDPSTGQLQPIYRMNNATGQWDLVNPTDIMSRGIAYWVYTLGASSYMAPLTLTLPGGSSLDFGLDGNELDLALLQNSGGAETVTITDTGSGNRPLACAQYLQGVPSWPPLPKTFSTNLVSGTNRIVRLTIQRGQMTNDSYSTVLDVRDGLGTLLHVPVTAQRQPGLAASGTGGAIPVALQAGLWVGDVLVNGVAETYNNPSNTAPVNPPFDLRLILHVDTNGTTRLLREVIQMFQVGSYTNNASGQQVLKQPGHYVLVTDNSLLGNFTGAALRDGTPVGRRYSTASFDFDPPGGTNYIVMSGTFGISNLLSCSITLTPSTPTNPFLHRYHPDHDNLDANYQPLPANVPQEIYTVTRQIQLRFTATDPTDATGAASTDYGFTTIGGIYNETVTGLHRNALADSGTFHLTRIATTAALNR